MSRAGKILSKFEEALKKSDLDAVRIEVTSSYDKKEMESFKDFEAFFDEVDVQNGYNDEPFKPAKWKPYFKAIWDEYKAGKLKLESLDEAKYDVEAVADFLANSLEDSDNPAKELAYVSTGLNTSQTTGLVAAWYKVDPKSRLKISMNNKDFFAWIKKEIGH